MLIEGLYIDNAIIIITSEVEFWKNFFTQILKYLKKANHFTITKCFGN